MAPSAALKLALDEDPTFYPEEEKLGEDVVQTLVAEAFRPLLKRYVDELGVRAFVGADQLMYYVQGDPTACVSPDVYVMPGEWLVNEVDRIGSWKKWECGVVPSFALEIMSLHNKKKKDDRKSPARHDALGTKELIVLDPYADKAYGMRNHTRFRIFRRDAKDRLVLVETTNDPIVFSEVLDCHLRVVGRGNFQQLRIATGPNGETLFPTYAEAEAKRADDILKRADAETLRADAALKRAQDEAKRAQDEAKRARDEAKRAAEAEAELERLRAELAALKRHA